MTWGLVAGAGAGWAASALGGATLGTAALIGGGTMMGVNAINSSQAAKNAANAQVAAQQQGLGFTQQQWEDIKNMQQPWLQAGQTALNALTPLALNYKPFDASAMYSDPGYQFRLSEGLKGVQQSAAARGLLQSGATLKGLERFGQDYASNEYTNAFNRYQAERQAQLGPLQSLAGLGQSSASQLGAQGTQVAGNMSELYSGIGNARASGYIGQANAMNNLAGGLTNLYGLYSQGNLINALNKKTT